VVSKSSKIIASSKSRIVNSSGTRRRTFKIDVLDSIADLGALIDKVAEVFASYLAFAANLERILTLRSESLDRTLETNTEVIGWHVEDFSYFVGNSVAIGVNVIYCGKLCRDLRR
jgi:hypothetical protein